MKIAYNRMSTVIEIVPGKCFGLIIENEQFLYQMLTDFKQATEGIETGIVVSKREQPEDVSKKVAFLTDFVGFDLNRKSLLSKIVSTLESNAKEARLCQTSQRLLADIENFISELTLDFPYELSCEKLSMQNLLKCAGVAIVDDFSSLEERLLAYMDLAREFEGKELFIFANLRCLISAEKLQRMIETALMREHNILLIDGFDYPKLEEESRMVVDKDLCEI